MLSNAFKEITDTGSFKYIQRKELALQASTLFHNSMFKWTKCISNAGCFQTQSILMSIELSIRKSCFSYCLLLDKSYREMSGL